MVDNRSAGLIGGIAGGINFRSDDNSGTAAKTADDRASQGSEYFLSERQEQEKNQKDGFVDRSMELRASLNSLALLNVVTLLRNNRNKSIINDDEDLTERIKPKRVEKISANKDNSNEENKKK